MKIISLPKFIALTLLALITATLPCSIVRAQGTAFTYQGRLNDGGMPASGLYDLRFVLFDASAAGNQAGGSLTNFSTAVTNGLFTVTLNFGSVFTGTNYWLDIAVRTNGAAAFTTLTTRQPVTPTPYAIFANTASNLSGTISGSGANLTALNAGNVSSGTLADGRLTGNVALLNRDGQIFTGGQVFENIIRLDSNNGFSQSSAGNFYIDAPFIVGGRFTVLTNGNTGVGLSNPSQKLEVAGDAKIDGALRLPDATAIYNADGNYLLRADNLGNQFLGVNFPRVTLVTGTGNVGVGSGAAFVDTSGSDNTAIGNGALEDNTNGDFNTASGAFALAGNTVGFNNTADGYLALRVNTNGFDDTATGYEAMFSNTSGTNNVANGVNALFSNTTGFDNTADGMESLYANINGVRNTASGFRALFANTSGLNNTADGYQALLANTTGFNNVAEGNAALDVNVGGSMNTAVGVAALGSNAGSDNNIALGFNAGFLVTGSSNICIGNVGTSTDTNIIRIGDKQAKTFIAGIKNTAVSGSTVTIDATTGQLGISVSSERFKENIHDIGDASDVLLALRPVEFQYKPEIDPQGTPQYGLVAEEVAKVDPDLVIRDDKNQILTVRYQNVDALLLNEFLKEHKRVEEQSDEIAELKKTVEELKAVVMQSKTSNNEHPTSNNQWRRGRMAGN